MIYAAIVRDVRDHMSVRYPEWWAAILMLAWGGWLERPVDSLSLSPSYAVMQEIATEDAWALFFIALAGARLFALLLNGTFRATRRWSPIVRAGAAAVSSGAWAFVAMLTWSANAGAPITPIVGMLAAGEFGLCMFVARRGGGEAREAR